MEGKINFQETRDIGELISVTFEFIKENFIPLGKALLYIAGPFVLLSGIFTSTVVIKMMVKYPVNSHVSLSELIKHMSSYSLVNYVFMFITNSVIAAVVYEYIVLYIDRGPEGFDLADLIEFLKEDALTLLAVMLLSSLLITAGFVLFFIPGIYLAVIMSPIIMVVLYERTSFPDAFNRSLHLVMGYWWFTFGFLLVMIIIQIVLMMAISLPINVISQAFIGPATGSMTKSSQIALMVTSVISSVNYFLYAIPMIGMAFHYFNLVQRKEGIGYREP